MEISTPVTEVQLTQLQSIASGLEDAQPNIHCEIDKTRQCITLSRLDESRISDETFKQRIEPQIRDLIHLYCREAVIGCSIKYPHLFKNRKAVISFEFGSSFDPKSEESIEAFGQRTMTAALPHLGQHTSLSGSRVVMSGFSMGPRKN